MAACKAAKGRSDSDARLRSLSLRTARRLLNASGQARPLPRALRPIRLRGSGRHPLKVQNGVRVPDGTPCPRRRIRCRRYERWLARSTRAGGANRLLSPADLAAALRRLRAVAAGLNPAQCSFESSRAHPRRVRFPGAAPETSELVNTPRRQRGSAGFDPQVSDRGERSEGAPAP